MKKRTKRLLAMLLASAMILQQGSTVAVLATESEPASETVTEKTAATDAETKTPETKAPETQAETKASETTASETQATEAAVNATQTETTTSETTETAAETTEKATEEQTAAPEESETEAYSEAETEKAEEKDEVATIGIADNNGGIMTIADGVSINDALKNVTMSQVTYKNEKNQTVTEAFDPLKKYPRDAQFEFELTYEFADGSSVKPSLENRVATYTLPAGLTNVLTRDGKEGTIQCDGKSAGTYTVNDDGTVTFTYSEDFLKTHSEQIHGTFTFSASLISEKTTGQTQTKFEFPGAGHNFDFTINWDGGKVKGDKKDANPGDVLDPKDGTVTWTIDLEVTELNVKNVKLEDILGDGLSFADPADFKLNGVAIDSSKVKIEGTKVILELGDLTIGKYTITYKTKVSSDYEFTEGKLSNTAKWTWDGEHTGEDTGYVWNWKAKGTLSKAGSESDGKITWTVTVDPGLTGSVAGKKIKDTLKDSNHQYVGKADGKVTVKVYRNDTGTLAGEFEVDITDDGCFEYTFPDELYDAVSQGEDIGIKYLLVYETEPTDGEIETGEKYENDVYNEEFGEGHGEFEKKEPSTDQNLVSKSGTVTNNEKQEVTWTITINAKDSWRPEITDFKLVDELRDLKNNPGAFTKEIVVRDDTGKTYVQGTDYDVIWTPEDKPTKVEITFKGALEKLKEKANVDDGKKVYVDLSAKYSIDPSLSTTVKNGVDSTYMYDGKPGKEHDEGSAYLTRVDFRVAKGGSLADGVATWTVYVNKEHSWDNSAYGDMGTGKHSVIDTLPEGMRYKKGSASYTKYTMENNTWIPDGPHEIEPTEENGKLTFILSNIGTSYVELTYQTEIVKAEIGSDGKITYTNHVDIEGKTAESTVELHSKIISKSGVQTAAELDNKIAYTIIVNYNAEKLTSDGKLILTDFLDAKTFLDITSITVKDRLTGQLVDAEISYRLTETGESELVMVLPDERSLEIIYLAELSWTREDLNKNDGKVNVKNDVTLSGIKDGNTSAETEVKIESSAATAGGSAQSISILKVNDDLKKVLQGAEFSLYRVETFTDLDKQEGTCVATATTGSDGKATFAKDGELESLQYNKLYYYVETKAPDHCRLDTEKHYFILKSDQEGNTAYDDLIKQIGGQIKFAQYQGGETIMVTNEEVSQVDVDFSGTKTVTGIASTDVVFTFNLYSADENFVKIGDPIKTTQTKGTITGSQSYEFESVPLTEAKTYYFVVEEQAQTDQSHYIFDSTTYHITVVVETAANGDLTKKSVDVQKIPAEGEPSAATETTLDFENQYQPDSTTATFTASKAVVGNPPAPETFTFKLYENSVAEGNLLDTKTVTGTGSVDFDEQSYSEAGTYTYKIKEEAGNTPGYTYDPSVYTVTVTVTDEDGVLTASIVYAKDEAVAGTTAPANAVFTNTYAQDKGSLKLTKTVTGATAIGKTYKFVVQNTDTNQYYNADGTVNDTEVTVEVPANGSVTIEDLPVGSYNVTEKRDGVAIAGYSLEVTGEGTATVTKDAQAEATITNTYTEDKGSLKVTKTTSGGTTTPDDTVFTVKNKAGDTVATEKYSDFKDEGYFVVQNLPVGEYTITESGAEVTNYTLTVTGDTTATVTKDAQAEITLNNTYTEDKGGLKVTKTTTGNTTPDSTVFTVTDKGGKTVATKTYSEFKTTGSFTVDGLEPGEYTVTESGAEVAGYTLTVTGDMTAELETDKTANVTIVNTYTQDKGSLKVTKVVSGGGSSAEHKKFKFTVQNEAKTKYYNVDGTESTNEVTIEVEAGGSVTVENLPVGKYVVTEKADSASIDGYSLEVTGEGNVDVMKGTEASKTITNTYTKNTGIVLHAKKEFNKTFKKGDFSFTLQEVDAMGKSIGDPQTAGNEDGGMVTFDEIKYSTEGTHYYTISEVIPTGENKDGAIVYDTTTYKVTVKVEPKDGVLVATADKATEDAPVVFTNKATTIKIDKTDKDSGAKLTGATLRIVDSKTGDVVEGPWKTDGKPHDVTGKLKIGGSYKLEETAAPAGYTIADPVEFSVNAEGQIVVGKDVVTTITMQDTKNKVSILKVDESGKALAGATLIVKDKDGKVVAGPWTTDGKAHEITGLAPGTYTLSELEAPKGYQVSENVSFEITGNETKDAVITVTMTDKKIVETKRSLKVTKHLHLDGITSDIMVRAATYYVALFTDAARTQRVTDVKKIVFNNENTSSATFDNLEAGVTYYVGETDENGTVIPAGRISENMIYYPTYDDNSTFTFEGKKAKEEGLAEFTNVYVEWPNYFYLSGQLTVTKQVLLGGEECDSDDTFYARIFNDAGLTDPVSDEVLVLDMAGGSRTSVTVTNLPIGDKPGSSRKYYVAETDEYGNPLDPDEVTEYTISVDKSEITLDASSGTPEVVITNDFHEEESEFESESEVDEEKTAPKTGEDTDYAKYLFLLTLSAGTCAVLFEEKRRKNQTRQ